MMSLQPSSLLCVARNLSAVVTFAASFFLPGYNNIWSEINENYLAIPGPRCGSDSVPPDPLAGGQGAKCPLSKNPTPALGLLGLELQPYGPRISVPPPDAHDRLTPVKAGNQSGWHCPLPIYLVTGARIEYPSEALFM